MSRIICLATPKVKPVRHTSRPSAPFGAGLFRFAPHAVLAPGFIEPSDQDRSAVGAMFADDPAPDYDLLAGEAAFVDAMSALTPPPLDRCVSCGEMAEGLSWGLCENCLEDAATDAAIALQNQRHMGQYRVF